MRTEQAEEAGGNLHLKLEILRFGGAAFSDSDLDLRFLRAISLQMERSAHPHPCSPPSLSIHEWHFVHFCQGCLCLLPSYILLCMGRQVYPSLVQPLSICWAPKH